MKLRGSGAVEGARKENGAYLCVDARALVVDHHGPRAERLHRESQAFDAFESQNLVQGRQILLLGRPLVVEWEPRQVLRGRRSVQEFLWGWKLSQGLPAHCRVGGVGGADVGADDGHSGRDVGSHAAVGERNGGERWRRGGLKERIKC